MTPFPPKTPLQMRREAERRRKAEPRTPAVAPNDIDQSRRPPLHSETGAELDCAIDWLAHVAAGRIEVK